MARRTFVRPARGKRRATRWIHASAPTPVAMTSCPSGATRTFGNRILTEGDLSLPTIVRIRACVHIEVAAETAAVTLQAFGIGVGLFDDRAFAIANAAGLPKPLLDADDESWMWYHSGFLGVGPTLAVSGPNSLESDGTGRRIAADIVVDSKAMRKWDENQSFVWVVENEPVEGTATEVEVTVFGRMLLKLA